MGIKGLLPMVSNACREGNVSEFCNKTIAIDVSCYLHKGLVGCMDKISQGKETDFYVYYVLKYIKLLLSHNCKVIMVFDGRPLPAKKDVNDQRREKREENRRLGEQLMKEGNMEEAQKMFRMTTSITAEMVEKTIEAARKLDKVDVVVAPYEADAQLAYLTNAGFAHAVVTEDSDLIVFGCERIIFKLNDSGPCTIYERSRLDKCVAKPLQTNFSFDTFRRICILAGCDYLQKGLPGVGLSKAETFFSKATNPDMRVTLPRIPTYLKMPKLKMLVTREFVNDFERAEKTFKYQIVFDPRERCQKPLNPYPLEEIAADEDDDDFMTCNSQDSDFKFAGIKLAPREATRLALGNQHGNLSKPSIQDKFVLVKPLPSWSIWNSEKCDDTAEEPSDFGSFTAFISTSVIRKVEKVATPEASRKRARVVEEASEQKPKKSALSKPKNGAFSPFNADELMRMYGGISASGSESITPDVEKAEQPAEENPPEEPEEFVTTPKQTNPFTPPKCSPYFEKGHFTKPRLKLGFLTKSKMKPLHKPFDRTTLLETEKENEITTVTTNPATSQDDVLEEVVKVSSSPSNPFAYRASGLRRLSSARK